MHKEGLSGLYSEAVNNNLVVNALRGQEVVRLHYNKA